MEYTSKIAKFPNSEGDYRMALPDGIVKELGLDGATVEITSEGNKIIIKKICSDDIMI